MVLWAITSLLINLLSSEPSILWIIISIGISLTILYFSIFITQAPNLYFILITWTLWYAIINVGLYILIPLFTQEPFGIQNVLALSNVALFVVFARLVMRYRHSVREAKKIMDSNSAQ